MTSAQGAYRSFSQAQANLTTRGLQDKFAQAQWAATVRKLSSPLPMDLPAAASQASSWPFQRPPALLLVMQGSSGSFAQIVEVVDFNQPRVEIEIAYALSTFALDHESFTDLLTTLDGPEKSSVLFSSWRLELTGFHMLRTSDPGRCLSVFDRCRRLLQGYFEVVRASNECYLVRAYLGFLAPFPAGWARPVFRPMDPLRSAPANKRDDLPCERHFGPLVSLFRSGDHALSQLLLSV